MATDPRGGRPSAVSQSADRRHGLGEWCPQRLRHGELDEHVGTVDVAVPKLRTGGLYSLWLRERRKRAERALIRVVGDVLPARREHAPDGEAGADPRYRRNNPEGGDRTRTTGTPSLTTHPPKDQPCTPPQRTCPCSRPVGCPLALRAWAAATSSIASSRKNDDGPPRKGRATGEAVSAGAHNRVSCSEAAQGSCRVWPTRMV